MTVVGVVVPELLEPLFVEPELVLPEFVEPLLVEPELVEPELVEPELDELPLDDEPLLDDELPLDDEPLDEEPLLDEDFEPVELLVAVPCEPEALVDEPELPLEDELLLAEGLGVLPEFEPLAVVLSVRLVLVPPEIAIEPARFAVAALRPYLYEAASTPSDATAKMFLVVLLTRQTPLRELALQECLHGAGSSLHFESMGLGHRCKHLTLKPKERSG